MRKQAQGNDFIFKYWWCRRINRLNLTTTSSAKVGGDLRLPAGLRGAIRVESWGRSKDRNPDSPPGIDSSMRIERMSVWAFSWYSTSNYLTNYLTNYLSNYQSNYLSIVIKYDWIPIHIPWTSFSIDRLKGMIPFKYILISRKNRGYFFTLFDLHIVRWKMPKNWVLPLS